jgi:hypothetical protein
MMCESRNSVMNRQGTLNTFPCEQIDTIEDAVLCMWSVPRLYNKDQLDIWTHCLQVYMGCPVRVGNKYRNLDSRLGGVANLKQ